jgi:hypothetical protein
MSAVCPSKVVGPAAIGNRPARAVEHTLIPRSLNQDLAINRQIDAIIRDVLQY